MQPAPRRSSIKSSIIITLVLMVAAVGALSWYLRFDPLVMGAISFFKNKSYETNKLLNVDLTTNQHSILSEYKPPTSYNDFRRTHFPANIKISGTFPPHIEEAIVKAVYDVNLVIPLHLLGDIEIPRPYFEGNTGYPTGHPEEGSVFIPANYSPFEISGFDVELTEYHVQRGLLAVFVNRVMSEEDKQQWLSMRNLKVPPYMKSNWEYKDDQFVLTKRDVEVSPQEDFNNVFIKRFIKPTHTVFTHPSNIVSPQETLFIRAMVAKFIKQATTEPAAEGSSVSIVNTLSFDDKAELRKLPEPFLAPSAPESCNWEVSWMDESKYRLRCVFIGGKGEIDVDFYKSKTDLEKDPPYSFPDDSSKYEEISLANGQTARYYPEADAKSDPATAITNSTRFMVYQPANRAEVVVLGYFYPGIKDETFLKNSMAEIAASVKEVTHDTY